MEIFPNRGEHILNIFETTTQQLFSYVLDKVWIHAMDRHQGFKKNVAFASELMEHHCFKKWERKPLDRWKLPSFDQACACNSSGWWFQRIWKILVKLEIFPK